jgi:hypothetical protein
MDSATNAPSSEGGDKPLIQDERCQWVSEQGLACANFAVEGFKFCEMHQPTCAYEGPEGAKCRNYATVGKYCVLHAPSDVDQPRASGEGTESLSDAIIHRHRDKAPALSKPPDSDLDAHPVTEPDQSRQATLLRVPKITRREFLTLGRWSSHGLRGSTVGSLPRPVKMMIGTAGSLLIAGLSEYLIADFLNYFKKEHGIEFFLPLTRDGSSAAPAGDSLDWGEALTRFRVINSGETRGTFVVEYVDYDSNRTYYTPGMNLDPKQSHLCSPDDAGVPHGFRGGAVLSSDFPARSIYLVKMDILESRFDQRRSQFLTFSLRILSPDASPQVTHVIGMLVTGDGKKLAGVSDVPCLQRENRLYFDRDTVDFAVKRTKARDAFLATQLEGHFVYSENLHREAGRHLSGYKRQEAAASFETTTELIPVAM